MDIDSWFFTRWIPGLSITISNKITALVLTQRNLSLILPQITLSLNTLSNGMRFPHPELCSYSVTQSIEQLQPDVIYTLAFMWDLKKRLLTFKCFLPPLQIILKMLVTITFKLHAKASFVARKVTVITGVSADFSGNSSLHFRNRHAKISGMKTPKKYTNSLPNTASLTSLLTGSIAVRFESKEKHFEAHNNHKSTL